MKRVHALDEPFNKELEISGQRSQSLSKVRLFPPFHVNAGCPSAASPRVAGNARCKVRGDVHAVE
jgi:hypothetical protein